MSESPRPESPVARSAAEPQRKLVMQPGVILAECAFRGYLALRGTRETRAFSDILAATIGLALPRSGAYTVHDDQFVIWTGPDEVLLSLPPGGEGTLERVLVDALAGKPHSVTDVSSGYTTFRIAGRDASRLIAAGCPLDLHPRAFSRGMCAGTHIAKAQVVILHIDESSEFHIIVRRSFADYLWLWLTDAGVEYGCSTTHHAADHTVVVDL